MIQKTGRLVMNGVVGGFFLLLIGTSMLRKAFRNVE